ncbi:MAG: hormogonium polysaccharide biosynthesis protein HpsA [Cyanobacteria bacterium P01_G01_bin.54]
MFMLRRLLQSFKQLMQLVAKLPSQLLHLLRRITRRQGKAAPSAGFVLPTVTMVILVVVLTSATLVFRSIDRAKNASNFRVNQVVMNAAAPAVERAKAKVGALFADTSLPRGTPSDAAIDGVFANDRYDLDDEVRLQVAYDYGDVNGIVTNTGNGGDGTLQSGERITTAWRFPVDTDNNGLYDSFTLYGVYYLSNTSRARQPVEARTRPQVLNAQNRTCEAAEGTSAGLVGSDGWFNQEGVLKKAFYVYVVNVPITELDDAVLFPAGLTIPAPYDNINSYEVFRGNRGFTAMEYQQDRARIPLGNNAIVYEDDLDLTSGPDFRINGRIIANSNLMGGEPQNNNVRLYQVSSDESCFYEEENAKILVAGNVRMGRLHDNNSATGRYFQVDLFQGRGQDVVGADSRDDGISDKTSSVNELPSQVAYNNKAYEARITYLVERVMADHGTQATVTAYKSASQDPSTVKTAVEERITANPELESELERLRSEELESWFRNRTRRVPSAEIAFGTSETLNGVPYQDYSTDNLRPIDAWILPTEANVPLTYRDWHLPALDPETRGETEELLGDRIVVGNNLPAFWWDNERNRFATEDTENTDNLDGTRWWAGTSDSPVNPNNNTSGTERYRKTQSQSLEEPGDTTRNGFWETNVAKVPEKKNEAVGGLRVVTGAGIYLPAELRATNDPLVNRANSRPRAEYVVWPDNMPQPPNPSLDKIVNDAELANHPYRNKIVERYSETTGDPIYIDDEAATGDDAPVRPYLKMRASAVYHYSYPDDPVDSDPSNDTAGRIPIACVSNFYDPTDWATAQNATALNVPVSGSLGNGSDTLPALGGRTAFSNNGVTYIPQRNSYSVNFNDSILRYQADLVYPNGRPVNPALKKALDKSNQGGQSALTLADRAAIDATYCGLDILANQLGNINDVPTAGFELVHGTIQEIAFLDGRQIKSIERSKGSGHSEYVHSYTLQRLTGGQSDFQNDSEPQYDLEIEQRLPLEIRATVIDLKRLRRGNGNNNDAAIRVPDPAADQVTFPDQEYMFPMSGIIYATRDDALPDASDRPTDPEPLTGQPLNGDPLIALLENEPNERIPADKISSTDYWLDPTRRPNGILLINGRELNREPDNRFVAEQDEATLTTEKGLTLASNLPVYIKAEDAEGNSNNRPGFNVHQKVNGEAVEEFTQLLTADWSNFYSRTEEQLDPNFACRRDDPRLTTCTTGDKWRVANVLSDAMTLLSERYRFGFRNEGDYDIRNNQSDNLFRDSEVLLTTGSGLRLHERFSVASKGLLAADFRMRSEYGSEVGAPFNDTNVYNTSIDELRRDNGFHHASLGVNGLSSNAPGPASNDAFAPFWTARSGGTHDRTDTNLRDVVYSTENNNTFNDIALNSSYFNNLISPVQRHIDNRYEYLMESCLKLPVSQCDPGKDWVIDSGGTYASNQLDSATPTSFTATNPDAGSTAIAPSAGFQHFPRRVAFLRYDAATMDINSLTNSRKDIADYNDGDLIIDGDGFPIPLGIDSSGNIMCHTYDDDADSVAINYSTDPVTSLECKPFFDLNNNEKPRKDQLNVLWYAPAQSDRNDATVIDNIPNGFDDNDKPLGLKDWFSDPNDEDNFKPQRHPQLVPVTQLNSSVGTDNIDVSGAANQPYNNTNWLPIVNDYGNNIHFNLVMATGDTPSRSNGSNGEENGGLANLPRLLETWSPGGSSEALEIKGSFIQLKRSTYATAPFGSAYPESYNFGDQDSLYDYKQRYLTGNGRFNHYRPPERQWGFDVGILSQNPDLFSQQFGLPATDEPNEFYREASRRDDWVRTLLCATAVQRDPNGTITDQSTGLPVVINADQRPSGTFCQLNTLN